MKNKKKQLNKEYKKSKKQHNKLIKMLRKMAPYHEDGPTIFLKDGVPQPNKKGEYIYKNLLFIGNNKPGHENERYLVMRYNGPFKSKINNNTV